MSTDVRPLYQRTAYDSQEGSVRARIWELFRSLGLTTVFGNPGSTEIPMLQDFPADFTYVLGLHEGTVVATATGYAFATGGAALVNLHTTAGVGNAMSMIVNAFQAHAPLVITAGQQDRRHMRTEPVLWGKQAQFVEPYVKWSVEPERSADVPEALARAYHVAMSEPRGPVFVSIPMDGLEEPCPAVVPRTVAGTMRPERAALERAAETISRGTRHALVVGADVDAAGGWDDAVRLAETLHAAVFSAPMTHRASFPTSHPQFVGALMPAQAELAEQLAEYDTVIVAGAPVFRYYPYVPGPVVQDGTQVVQLTSDPAEASRALVGQSVIGNVAASLAELNALVRPPAAPQQVAKPQQPAAAAAKPITPEFLYQTLERVLPEDAVVTEEAEGSRAVMLQNVRFDRPRSFFATASGTLGVAMPAAVGIKLAQPDRPVVCCVGDGSVPYAVQSLYTAVRYRAPVAFVVLNNGEYGILKSFADLLGSQNVPALDVPGLDFAGLARGFGAQYRRVDDPAGLEAALREAIASPSRSYSTWS